MSDSVIGLAGLGFWLFIAAAVVSSIWDDIRKRETRHATLRALIASGQQVDQAAVDRLLGKAQRSEHDMRVGAIVLRYIAFGLVALGGLLALMAGVEVLFALLGVAAFLGLLSMGISVAANYSAEVEATQPAAPDDIVLPGRSEESTGDSAPPPRQDLGE
ncbi:MAG: hypothetical protein AAF184_13605 [Pseudomonadota bacterium]